MEESNQKIDLHNADGKFAAGSNANPTGKGGFGDHPENRSNGRWRKDESISYYYNKLGRMSIEEFKQLKPKNLNQAIVKTRLLRAAQDNDQSLKETIEITNRTEGRPKQNMDNLDEDRPNPIIKGFVLPVAPEDFIDNYGRQKEQNF